MTADLGRRKNVQVYFHFTNTVLPHFTRRMPQSNREYAIFIVDLWRSFVITRHFISAQRTICATFGRIGGVVQVGKSSDQ
jgi:hypothetical protein